MKTLKELFELETKKKWWVNPVCHGEVGFCSDEYMKWLEDSCAQLEKQWNAANDAFSMMKDKRDAALQDFVELMSIADMGWQPNRPQNVSEKWMLRIKEIAMKYGINWQGKIASNKQ